MAMTVSDQKIERERKAGERRLKAARFPATKTLDQQNVTGRHYITTMSDNATLTRGDRKALRQGQSKERSPYILVTGGLHERTSP